MSWEKRTPSHILKSYLDTEISEKHKTGTPYRITLHHMPEANLTWVEGTDGSRNKVSDQVLSMALCDAEILDLGEEPEKKSDPTWKMETRGNLQMEISKESHNKTCPEKDHLSYGPRLKRTIAPTLKRQVIERDMNQCTVPGCSNKMYLHAHHIKPVSRGGKNRKENLTILCSYHHKEVHEGNLTITGNAPGEIVWKNRFGKILKDSCIEMRKT